MRPAVLPSLAVITIAAFLASPAIGQTAPPPPAPPPLDGQSAPTAPDDHGATDATAASEAAQTAGPLPESSYSIEIPTITAVGSNVDEDALRAILGGDIASHAVELAGLNADSIVIPDYVVKFSVPDKDGKLVDGEMTYQGIELSGVASGVAATASIDSGHVDTPEGAFDIGSIGMKDFDIGALLAFYGLVPTSSDEMRTLYRDFTMAGGSLVAEDVNCTFGAVTNAEFKGRPLSMSFGELMALGQQMEAEGDDVSPENVEKMARFYADFIYAFESAPTLFDGLDCTGKDDEDRPMAVSLGGMAVGGFAPGIYPEVSVSDLRVAVEGDGEVSLGNFTLGSIDFSGPATLIRETTEPLTEAWFEANARKLIPAFSGGSLENLAVDIPNEDVEGERIIGSIAAANLTLGGWRNGIPTEIAHSATDFSVTIPPDSKDESMQRLSALGFTDLNFGYSIAANWDEAASAINVSDFSIDADDFGSVVAAAVLGNATTAIFDDNAEVALAASMGLTFKSVNFDLTDAGLLGIALEQAAKDQGTNADALRAILSGTAQGAIFSIMGASPQSTELANAIQTFLTGNKTLTVGIDSKDEAGVPLMTFMAAEQDPMSVISQLDITAKAE